MCARGYLLLLVERKICFIVNIDTKLTFKGFSNASTTNSTNKSQLPSYFNKQTCLEVK